MRNSISEWLILPWHLILHSNFEKLCKIFEKLFVGLKKKFVWEGRFLIFHTLLRIHMTIILSKVIKILLKFNKKSSHQAYSLSLQVKMKKISEFWKLKLNDLYRDYPTAWAWKGVEFDTLFDKKLGSKNQELSFF